MADSGKQSPLGVNVLGSIIDNIGFWINPEAESYMGKSKLTWTEIPGSGADYARTSENLVFGKTVEESCLKWVTWSINDAFFRGAASKANVRAAGSGITVLAGTYNNIVNIGQNSTTGGKYLPALGNSPPFDNWTNQNADSWDPTYQWKNPHPEYVNWGLAGPPATASYGLFNWEKPVYEGPYPVSSPFTPVDRVNFAYMNEGQLASWWPFRATAPLAGGPGASTGAPGATGAPVGSGPGPNSYAGCTPGPVDVKWEPKFEEYTAPGENTQNPWRWVPGSDGASGEVYSIRIGPMSEWAQPVPEGAGTGWTNPGTPMLFGGSFCARPGYPTPNNWEWCISECPGDFDNPIPTTSVDPTRYPSRPAKGRFGGEYGSFEIAYGRGKFAHPWAGDGDPNKTYYFNFKFQPGTALFLDLMLNYEWQMNWDGIPTLDPAATPTGGGTVSTSIVDSTTPGLPPPPAGTGEYILHKGAGLGTAAGTVTAEQNKIVAIQILSPNNRLAVQNEPPTFPNGLCETWSWEWNITTTVGKAQTARFNLSETPADMTNSAYTYPPAQPYTPGTTITVDDHFPNYYLCWGPPQDTSITTTPISGQGPYTVLDPSKTYYLNVEVITPAAAQFRVINNPQGYLGGGTTWGSTPLPSPGIAPPPGFDTNAIAGPVNQSTYYFDYGTPDPNQSSYRIRLDMNINETACIRFPASKNVTGGTEYGSSWSITGVAGASLPDGQVVISPYPNDFTNLVPGNQAYNSTKTIAQGYTSFSTNSRAPYGTGECILESSKYYYVNIKYTGSTNGYPASIYIEWNYNNLIASSSCSPGTYDEMYQLIPQQGNRFRATGDTNKVFAFKIPAMSKWTTDFNTTQNPEAVKLAFDPIVGVPEWANGPSYTAFLSLCPGDFTTPVPGMTVEECTYTGNRYGAIEVLTTPRALSVIASGAKAYAARDYDIYWNVKFTSPGGMYMDWTWYDYIALGQSAPYTSDTPASGVCVPGQYDAIWEAIKTPGNVNTWRSIISGEAGTVYTIKLPAARTFTNYSGYTQNPSLIAVQFTMVPAQSWPSGTTYFWTECPGNFTTPIPGNTNENSGGAVDPYVSKAIGFNASQASVAAIRGNPDKDTYINIKFENPGSIYVDLSFTFGGTLEPPPNPGSSVYSTPATTTVSTASEPPGGTGSAVPNRGITQWGWVRLIALQAWNEFNYNNELKIKGYNTQRYWIQEPLKNPEYRMFCDSFMSFYGFMQSTNEAIYSLYSAYTPEPDGTNTFLKGSYSNMDDLVTADIAGVTLAFRAFGQDLLNLGRIIDWQYVSGFGLPSGLLKSLYKNNALTSSLNLILLTAGLSQTRVNDISTGNESATKEEEQQMYGAFLVTVGEDLKEILTTCNCSTAGLTSLGDCLNVKKLFPNSYTALTVPLYNTTQSAAQSAKTYYPLITPSTTNLNISLNNGAVRTVVGTLVPEGAPPIIESVQTAETATIAAAAGILESPFSINEVDLPSKTNTILTRIQQNLNRNGTTLGSAVQDDIQKRLSQGIVAVKTATGIGSFIEQQLTSTTVSTNNLPSVPAPNPQPTTIPEATGSSAIVSGSSTGQTLAKTGGGTITAQDKLNLDDK